MKVYVFFLVLSLTLFQTGQTCKDLIHGEVYTFQNSYDNKFLTAAPSDENSKVPSGIMTNKMNVSKLEQLWEVNVASEDDEDKRRVLIRSLEYSNNNATFKRKFSDQKQKYFRKVIYFHCDPVNSSQTSWYLKRAIWHWKGVERVWTSSECLTTQKNGTVGFSPCYKKPQDKPLQQWKIHPVDA